MCPECVFSDTLTLSADSGIAHQYTEELINVTGPFDACRFPVSIVMSHARACPAPLHVVSAWKSS